MNMNWKSPDSLPTLRSAALDLPGLTDALLAMRGANLLIHHFATWCDPCEDELPLLGPLLRDCASGTRPVRRVAISWDLFLVPAGESQVIAACTEFLARHGAPFDDLIVYTGAPEELFESQRIEGRTVPFTELRSAQGERVAEFRDPVFEEAERKRLSAAISSLQKELA